MKKPAFLAGILLFFVCVLLVSCPWGESFDRETLDAERQLWDEQGLRDYSFYLDFFFLQNTAWKGTVAVKDGALFGYATDDFLSDSIRFDDLEGPFQRPLLWEWLSPIPEIYENIRSKSLKKPKITSVEVGYNGIYHFPEHVYINETPIGPIRIPGDGGASYSFSITRFAPNPELEQNIPVFDRETFGAERQLWQEQVIRWYYSFRLDYRYDNRPVWGGTIIIRPLIVNGTIIDPDNSYVISYTSDDDINDLGAWRWVCSMPEIYGRIIHDSESNPGLEWGRKSRTSLEAEYSNEYHFPTRYRYYAELVEPSDQERVYRLYEIAISDFTLLDPKE